VVLGRVPWSVPGCRDINWREIYKRQPTVQDHFLNAANWQWLSASAFFNQYYRVYSPVTFGKKYDPNGNFIKKFVPQVRTTAVLFHLAIYGWFPLLTVQFRSVTPTSPYSKTSHSHQTSQLAKFPAKYIYEPWTAPLAVQQSCGCVLGRDYPFPIVDHTAASKRNMERMKAAYARNK
jgi:cryptochrome